MVTSNLYGPLRQPLPLAAAYNSTQTNILIDHDFHPRLTDYGLITTVLDPDTVYSNVVSPYAIQYVAPELLNPPGFDLKDSTPTKKSDVYGFGMVMYQVSNTYFISGTANKYSIQVITEQKPFSGTRAGAIICKIVTGERPGRPLGPNEWLSDSVWDFISRCWSPSLDDRPDVKFTMNALNDAADVVDIRHGKLRTTTNDQGKQTSRQAPGASCGSYHKQTLTVVINSILEDPRDSVSIHYQNTPGLQGDEERAKKYLPSVDASSGTNAAFAEVQLRGFRMWHDSTGSHRHDAALVDDKAGAVHLSSADGALLEIPKDKLSPEDLNYLRSIDADKKAKSKVSPHLSHLLVHPLIQFGTGFHVRYVPNHSVNCIPSYSNRYQTIGYCAEAIERTAARQMTDALCQVRVYSMPCLSGEEHYWMALTPSLSLHPQGAINVTIYSTESRILYDYT